MNTIKYIDDDYYCHFERDYKDIDNFLIKIHSKISGDLLEITDNMNECEQSAVNSIILLTREVILKSIIMGRIYG